MSMTRQERITIHKKQERITVKRGTPNVNDLREGIPVLRSTSEGVIEFIKHNGIMHKKVLDKV